MEKNFDNLLMILDKCKEDMHSAASEEELQQLIDEALNYIVTCNSDLEQAQKTIEMTNEQLAAITDAHKESENRAEAAAVEESDAHTAWEMAQKMLDDATIADGLANKEAAMILQKAATVLQDTVANAEEFYHKKAQEKEEIDAATIRLLATQKAIEYTAARAYTTEGIRLRDVVLAQLMSDLKVGEKEVVGWQKSLDEIGKEKEEGRFADKISALQESLRAAEEKIDLNIIAEEDEHNKQQAYIQEQQISCQERLAAIDEQIESKTAERAIKEDELTSAKDKYDKLLAESNSADLTAEQVALDIDEAINKDKEEKAAAFARLDDEVEQVRQSVAIKKQDYLSVSEKARAAASHLDDVKQQLASLQQKAGAAKAEEESAHEAAEVARRLVDNAVKVRLSIGQESADLLLSAQEALTESATAAEELEQKKYQYRIDLEQKCQEMAFNVEQAEKDVDSADHDVVFAKAVWENEEAELVKEIENVSIQKNELDDSFDHKTEEYDIRLTTVRNAAEKVRSQLASAKETVADLEKHLTDLAQNIATIELERSHIEKDIDEICTNYLAESQARLGVILADKQLAQNEAELYRRELGTAQNDLAALDARETELSARLAEAQARVAGIIEAGSEQVLAAEIELESRKEAEETARQAADEIAEYIEENNIPQVDYSTIPLVNEANCGAEPIDEAIEAAPAAESSEDLAEDTDKDNIEDADSSLADEEEPGAEELAAEDESLVEDSLEDLLEEIDEIIENTRELAPIDEAAVQDEGELENETPDIDEELDIIEDATDITEDIGQESAEKDIEAAAPDASATAEETEAIGLEIADAILETNPQEEPTKVEPKAEDAFAVEQQPAEVKLAESEKASTTLEEAEPLTEADDAEARRRAEEEAEEAAILAGLTGSFPKIDADDTDESAEYTAWLDIISSDVIEKLMNEGENKDTAANQADVNDWIADLEQTFIKEDLALKHNDDEPEKEAAKEQAQNKDSASDGHKDKHSNKKNKKNKKSFRFF